MYAMADVRQGNSGSKRQIQQNNTRQFHIFEFLVK